MAMNDVECCEENCIHAELLKKAREKMPDEDELYDLAVLFKVFGDSTRIRILFVLFGSEVCVCDLAETLNMTQSAVSHQLKILKQAKLVSSRREGKSVFYSLADEHVRTIIDHAENILKNEEDIIMKKKFKLEDLDCANCAAKMEEAIKKIPGVNDAVVSFMTQKMTIDAEDERFEEIMDEVAKTCAKVEPDCRILR